MFSDYVKPVEHFLQLSQSIGGSDQFGFPRNPSPVKPTSHFDMPNLSNSDNSVPQFPSTPSPAPNFKKKGGVWSPIPTESVNTDIDINKKKKGIPPQLVAYHAKRALLKKKKQDKAQMPSHAKKKKKKKCTLTNSDIVMHQILPPKKCTLQNTYRRYTIRFQYSKRAGEKKKRWKTINFGDVRSKDYVDHKNPQIRSQLMGRIRNYHTPFKSNFWRVYLLNGAQTDILQNYLKVIKGFHLI